MRGNNHRGNSRGNRGRGRGSRGKGRDYYSNNNNDASNNGDNNVNDNTDNNVNNNATNNEKFNRMLKHYPKKYDEDSAKGLNRKTYSKKERYKKYNQQDDTQSKTNNTEPQSGIDPNYDKKEVYIQGRLLEIELKQDDEANKEANKQNLVEIQKHLSSNYNKEMEKLEEITTTKKKESIFDGQNIFQKIVYSNPLLARNCDLVCNLLEIFKQDKNQEELQTELIDLLGYDNIETVSEFIQNTSDIKELISVAKASIEDQTKIEEHQENLKMFGKAGPEFNRKKQRKTKKRVENELENLQEENIKILKQLGFENLFFQDDFESNEPHSSSDTNVIRKAFGSEMSRSLTVGEHNVQKYSTEIRKEFKYQLIKVKPVTPKREPVTLVSVAQSIPEWAQRCFNFNYFNEVQSTVFNKAFKTDENLLIAAPTGAGKTNIALLTILREIEKELADKGMRNLRKDFDFQAARWVWNFKIIYLAPLKALAGEIVNKFNTTLKFLNIVVNEFSGDVNLSKEQIDKTNLFIGIPEKWDLFTRKNDDIFVSLKLMIIDEVHLLHEDRGSVLECIVARTIRKMEYHQKFIRLCALSATLPNYWDVAEFLRVKEGLFSFDSSYRSTPLSMKFFGLKDNMPDYEYTELEDKVCYDQVVRYLKKDKQVIVFVHTRMETINYAQKLLKIAEDRGELKLFTASLRDLKNNLGYTKVSNKKLVEIIPYGVGFHNAGILRKDRNVVEALFSKGVLNVLVSTSTLAWGVNLPAYAVIIKGTTFYNVQEGGRKDISILDVQQMFGRAGRPQFDVKGVGIIISSLKTVLKFIGYLKNQTEIESSLEKKLPDALNAEIVIGNINSVQDAIGWFKLTYFAIRLCGAEMNKNIDIVKNKIVSAFRQLNLYKLIRYSQRTEQVHCTELGRIACKYYMNYQTVHFFDENLSEGMFDEEILTLFARSEEFAGIKIYNDEYKELEKLGQDAGIISKNLVKDQIKILVAKKAEQKAREKEEKNEKNGKGFKKEENKEDEEKERILKVLTLIETFLKGPYEFRISSLHMDCSYIIDNAPRIFRAMVEISLHKHFVKTTILCLNYMKMIERRIYPGTNPLWQFTYESERAKNAKQKSEPRGQGYLGKDICKKLDSKGLVTLNSILKEDKLILSKLLNISKENAVELVEYAKKIPNFIVEVEAKPLTRTILNITVTLRPKFHWSKRWNHVNEPFWILVDNQKEIIHSEFFVMTPRQDERKYMKESVFTFAVPFDIEPGKRRARLESIYTVNIVSDRWLDCQFQEFIQLNEIEVPQDEDVQTELLDLLPLPLSALQKKEYEQIFSKSFKFFNPVQTQIFYSCYNTNENLLVGAPTGSGKTVIAELAILRLFNTSVTGKAIYIAPLKSLAKERLQDWKKKFAFLDKNIIELTGDYTPDLEMLLNADILITTPEKWDGISRNWHHRDYVKRVSLVIIDEIHLLGLDRGPVIEVIVSRMRFIANKNKSNVRFIGLSTALANSTDVADWLGISTKYDNKRAPGLYNFKPAVRPCPVVVHIEGFPEKHYCPRMATMNKPCYNAINNFSDGKPVLIFVSSRRQTRLTALDLIALSASNAPGVYSSKYLKIPIEDISSYLECVTNEDLRHTLEFGIGMHHAGLPESDRKIVEELFFSQKIQVLVATATLAWGVNFPAHLVIIKGTEYHDAKTCTYVDMPITDILQMIGRAGRPQYDDEAVACLFVKQDKKNFYKKFLYEPFPLESSLHKKLYDHINAEISSGMLTSINSCIDYLKWTYFFKRLVKNPTYYGLNSNTDAKTLNKFMEDLIKEVLDKLIDAGCVIQESDKELKATNLGNIASFYYISYKTAKFYNTEIKPGLSINDLIDLLSRAEEFADVPVRHNEDKVNKDISHDLPIKMPNFDFGTSRTKTHLLIQAYLCRMPMPITDYNTDLKLVLDNCIRILLVMADIANEKRTLDTLLSIIMFIQMISQGIWDYDSSLYALPHLTLEHVKKIIKNGKIQHLCEICEMHQEGEDIEKFLTEKCNVKLESKSDTEDLIDVISKLPILDISFRIYPLNSNNLEREYKKPIRENGDAQISIDFTKLNDKNNNLIVHSRYGKIKSCRWFIIVGNVKTNKVLAFEKVSFKGRLRKKLNFIVPHNLDDDSLQLFILSDSYIGLDQQYPIPLKRINERIMRRYGIIEVKSTEVEKEKKDDSEEEEEESDKETKNEENEEEDSIYLENW